jgi:hypothetical protein
MHDPTDGARRGKPVRKWKALWLGQMVSEEFLHRGLAASPAGNRWQTGLLTALAARGVAVDVRGCTPQPAWPVGPLRSGRHEGSAPDGNFGWSMESFLNLPIAKLLTQYGSLLKRVLADVARSGPPAVTVSYNVGLPEALTARWLQRRLGIPWVCIMADLPGSSEPGTGAVRRHMNEEYARRQQRWLRQAQGRVYLSWELYENDPGPRKLYLEGGVRQLHPKASRGRASEVPILMFAGSLAAWTGVELLVDAMMHVTRECELWICGRGPLASRVEDAASCDPRVRFYGLVTDAELDRLMGQASIFVNPRPTHVPENRYNFPSKLLDYFSWGRPVLSTLTQGIPPAYRSLVLPIAEETPRGLAAAIDRVLGSSAHVLEEAGDRIRSYVADHLLWSTQAERLQEWIEVQLLSGTGSVRG